MSALSRRQLLAASAASAAALALPPHIARAADLKSITLAEPAHLFPYVPVYLAIDQGFFAKHGLDVKLTMVLGGGHVAALVSGSVWGNLGGAESDAMSDNGTADPVKAICNFVNRALIYMCAKKGTRPASNSAADLKAFCKGKKLALSRYGGTPDVLARQWLESIGIDLKTDVTIINNGAIADAPTLVKAGAADIAVATEPQVSFGVYNNIWEEPFHSFSSLGPYSFSVISVKESTIKNDPATVQAFVTGLVEALKAVQTNRPLVEATIKKDFPTLEDAIAKAALDRCYRDKLFSLDGYITQPAYEMDMKAVYDSGEMTRRVPYADVVDMTFVDNANKKK